MQLNYAVFNRLERMISSNPAHPTVHHLPFFPASFPDETLLSRGSRFHILAASASAETTLKVLFGENVSRDKLCAAAPPNLRALARLIPGQPRLRLGELLEKNTFVAFVTSMVTDLDWAYPGPQFAVANICVACAAEDRAEDGVGISYLRRAHQLPGVKACWLHKVILSNRCPCCAQLFFKDGKLVSAPMIDCDCGWNPSMKTTPGKAPAEDVNFARRARTVFEARTNATPTSSLINFFELHLEHSILGRSSKKALPALDLGREIAALLEKQHSSIAISSALAGYLRSGKGRDRWVANLNPDYLAMIARYRENLD